MNTTQRLGFDTIKQHLQELIIWRLKNPDLRIGESLSDWMLLLTMDQKHVSFQKHVPSNAIFESLPCSFSATR